MTPTRVRLPISTGGIARDARVSPSVGWGRSCDSPGTWVLITSWFRRCHSAHVPGAYSKLLDGEKWKKFASHPWLQAVSIRYLSIYIELHFLVLDIRGIIPIFKDLQTWVTYWSRNKAWYLLLIFIFSGDGKYFSCVSCVCWHWLMGRREIKAHNDTTIVHIFSFNKRIKHLFDCLWKQKISFGPLGRHFPMEPFSQPDNVSTTSHLSFLLLSWIHVFWLQSVSVNYLKLLVCLCRFLLSCQVHNYSL